MIEVKEKSLKGKTFIDLFAGIGAFRLALESYGAQCVFSSEWDKYAQETYAANFGDTPAGDITKIRAEDIPPHDILCAGFPCQPFSISGSQKGFEDTRGTLFFDIVRIIRHRKPSIVLLENVKNFATHDNGNTLRVVVETLEAQGYVVFKKVINAATMGCPTARERIYFVCFKKGLRIHDFTWPAEFPLEHHLEDYLLPDAETTKYVVNRNDVIWCDACQIDEDDDGPIEEEKYSADPIRLGIVNKGCQGERIYSPKGVAITLSAYGGGAGAKTGLYWINGRIRKLAPRECARVMGFPDSYKIHQNNIQAYKQFGNSIVVDVLQHILGSIVQHKGVVKWLQK